MRQLLLASESPRRRELLAALGIPFKSLTAPVEELTFSQIPAEVPLLNARRKAEAVAERHPEALVLGADTVILFQDKIIGKPHDLVEAEQILLTLSGQTHQVLTGIALICRSIDFYHSWQESSEVVFKPFTRDTVKRYLEMVPVLDKAGAYAIQEHGEMLIDRIFGDVNNIIGLPLAQLKQELTLALAL